MTNHNFKAGTLGDVQKGLSSLYPDDKVFEAKVKLDSNLYQLLRGFAYELFREENKVQEIMDNLFLTHTENLIEEWERAMGIPNECFPVNEELSRRINHVLAKFRARGVTTVPQFVALAAFLGIPITIEQLGDNLYPPYNVPNYPVNGAATGNFVWIIKGPNLVGNYPPYNVPNIPENPRDFFTCFFQTLKPANTYLIFENSTT